MESATAEAEPSSRPARRWAADRNGMIARERAASTIPGVECCASPVPVRARTESTATYVASAKKENAMMRSAVFSRASRTSCSAAENCQATAAAEETSLTESRPKPTSAVDEARVPARDVRARGGGGDLEVALAVQVQLAGDQVGARVVADGDEEPGGREL